jgi:AcrR family transcriptional regulator
VASKIVDKILEGATDLFARQGYFGSSTREIALRSDVAEPSIYRLFLNKEKLFHECLTAVVERSLDPEQFMAVISGEAEEGEFSALVTQAVRRWYFSLSARSARLLMQAILSDNETWTEMAYSRIDKIIEILTRKIANEVHVPKAKAAVAARTLILALFQFKIARSVLGSAGKERDAVDMTIDQWLHGLPQEVASGNKKTGT